MTQEERRAIVRRAAEAGAFHDQWEAYSETDDESEEEMATYRATLAGIEALFPLPRSLKCRAELIVEAFCGAYREYHGVEWAGEAEPFAKLIWNSLRRPRGAS